MEVVLVGAGKKLGIDEKKPLESICIQKIEESFLSDFSKINSLPYEY